MPVSLEVFGAVRDRGSHEVPVAVVRFIDIEGEWLELHLDPRLCLQLALELAKFNLQVHP